MKLSRPAFAAVLAATIVMGSIEATHAQNAVPPQFSKLNMPEVDELANDAMSNITRGMSGTLIALDAGKRAGTTIDPKLGEEALGTFSKGRSELSYVLSKIPLRKINRETILQSEYAKAYMSLVSDLKAAGYPEPEDSKTYINIIISVTDHCMGDVKTLITTPMKPANQKALVDAFLDLINQKALLEHIGATSQIITIAMQ